MLFYSIWTLSEWGSQVRDGLFSLSFAQTHTRHTLTYSCTFIICLPWQLSTRMCSSMLYREREKERSEQYCRWVLMNSSSPGHTYTHTQTHSPAETAWHIALITWCIYCLLPMSLSNSWPIVGLHAGPCQHLSCTVSEGSGILSQKILPWNFLHTVTQTCPCGKTKRNVLEHIKEFHLFRKERNEAK